MSFFVTAWESCGITSSFLAIKMQRVNIDGIHVKSRIFWRSYESGTRSSELETEKNDRIEVNNPKCGIRHLCELFKQ